MAKFIRQCEDCQSGYGNGMRTKDWVWLALFILAVSLTIALKYVPYLPGDVSCTRLVQSLLPESKRWAQLLSSTAEMPWVLVLIAAAFCLSWMISGRRAALLSLASFIGLWLLGKWLGPIVAQPRPSPELVRVTGSFSGSAFPSIFALNYASTVGFLAVLAGVKTTGKLGWSMVLFCSSLLLMGWIARVDLAAHWPSDVGVSYLIGFLWVSLLIRKLMPRENNSRTGNRGFN
jgi:membrane-associated phospholipid phosphatase